MSRRLIAPTVTPVEGGWRMYMEARGPADELTAIASAFSSDPDALEWEFEAGLRLTHPTMGFGGPRYTPLPGGGGRLFLFASVTRQTLTMLHSSLILSLSNLPSVVTSSSMRFFGSCTSGSSGPTFPTIASNMP